MTASAQIDVLVVDDTAGAAEDYAQVISAETGLSVAFADDPSRALEIAKTSSLKVLVLDQRMPVPGTDLYTQIRAFAPYVRAIMLTGEAGPDEVGEAMELGFNAYVPKGLFRQRLVSTVLHEYAAHAATVAAASLAGTQPVVLVRRGPAMPWNRPKVTYRLRSFELVSDSHVLPGEWTTIVTLHAGQVEKVTEVTEVEDTIVLETETAAKLSSQLGFSLKQVAELKSQLSSELTARFKSSKSVRSRASRTIEVTYQLDPEPSDPDELHVRLRRIQHAPVYRRFRGELVSDCECCSHSELTVIDVLMATGRRAVRHDDRLSNGEVRLRDLGAD